MKTGVPIIEIDASAGFCSGVNRAIKIIADSLEDGKPLFCLGDVVHNEAELQRLEKNGARFIDHSQLSETASRVFIRAHGEPPETYNKLTGLGTEVIDATCPVVLRLQQKIRIAAEKCLHEGRGKVVIFGKPGHPEVIGLLGQAPGKITLISTTEQARELEISGPVYLFAQTTASEDIYKEVADIITRKAILSGTEPSDVAVTSSICRQMSQRAPAIREFAAKHDVVIFVSGSASSNGKYLSGIAKEVNPHTYVVSGVNEIGDWFGDAASVGISGATSTPQWLMQAVATHIENHFTK